MTARRREIHLAAHRLNPAELELTLLLSGPRRVGCTALQHPTTSPGSETQEDKWPAFASPLRPPPREAHPRTKRLSLPEEEVQVFKPYPGAALSRVSVLQHTVVSCYNFDSLLPVESSWKKIKEMKLKCYF